MDTEQADVLDFAALVAAASSARQLRKHRTGPVEILGAAEFRDAGELVSRLMAALGPNGPGLVAVRGVPQYEDLRNQLLPMARTLALMPRSHQNAVLKNNLGTDVPLNTPNRPVSSFAAQLQFRGPRLFEHWETDCGSQECQSPPQDDGTNCRHIGSTFRRLGLCMVKLGLLVASLCDLVVDGAELEKTMLSSGTAKGRLIHYHAVEEHNILSGLSNFKQTNAAKRTSSSEAHGKSKGSSAHNDGRQEESKPDQVWQDWHLDYGVFTILTAPLFCKVSSTREEEHNRDTLSSTLQLYNQSPCGHSLLRILHGRSLKFIQIPPDCLVIQVGEAAQILSGGKMRATPHCVCRPSGGDRDISRETFAVFLQPSWDKALLPPLGCDKTAVLHANVDSGGQDEIVDPTNTIPADFSFLERAIPPLSSRWTEGCTFADFSRRTTRQYYGAAGRQHISSS